MKARSLAFVALVCNACTHRSSGQPAVPPAPALAVNVSYIASSGIGMGCLPRARDSTRFEVSIVVDSIRATGGAISLIRRDRSAPRPGYVNQVVTVEVQRAGQTRFVGTSCWHDAGIVIRGPTTTLADAQVFLDAPGTILVRVLDGRGAILHESIHRPGIAGGDRISWLLPPAKLMKLPAGTKVATAILGQG